MGSSILGIRIIWPSELSSIKYIWIKRKIFRDFLGLPWWLRDKESAWMQEAPETWVQSQSQEDPLEEEMATHSSIPARKIPWTEEPGGLRSMGWKRVTQLSNWTHTYTSWQTSPYFHWRGHNQKEKQKQDFRCLIMAFLNETFLFPNDLSH